MPALTPFTVEAKRNLQTFFNHTVRRARRMEDDPPHVDGDRVDLGGPAPPLRVHLSPTKGGGRRRLRSWMMAGLWQLWAANQSKPAIPETSDPLALARSLGTGASTAARVVEINAPLLELVRGPVVRADPRSDD